MSTQLTVEGMSCGGCEQTVEEALRGLEGVDSASANQESNTVVVEGDPDPDELVTVIEDAGYEVPA